MPDGLCARCNRKEPKMEFIFDVFGSDYDEKGLKLGFCSDACFVQFRVGIQGAKSIE
jgi:hypothetical protein